LFSCGENIFLTGGVPYPELRTFAWNITGLSACAVFFGDVADGAAAAASADDDFGSFVRRADPFGGG
jgi:hypothetical protein